MSENCLTLNIYVPRSLQSNSSEKLPIMIWVHGDGQRTPYYGEASAWPSG